MEKKTKKTKENKQIVEIHIYVHQSNTDGIGGGNGIFYYQCTCGKGTGITSAPCPVHPFNPPYTVTC